MQAASRKPAHDYTAADGDLRHDQIYNERVWAKAVHRVAADGISPEQAVEGYGQFWGMRSGSGLVLGGGDRLAVAEADTADDVGEAVGTIESAQKCRLADLASLKTMASAVARDRQPLVWAVRSRTVAKVLSTGFVLRTCFQCSAGKA